MAGKLDIYNLGKMGVSIDRSPVHTQDGELLKAQNAIREQSGSDGALRKRLGLTKLNAVAMSGSVFGVINVPLTLVTVRRFLIGIDQAITTTYQWLTSVDGFGVVATATTPGAPSKGNNHAFPFYNSTYRLTHRGIQVTDTMFLYPAEYTRGTPQPVRSYDGTTDQELFKVPVNPRAVADHGLTVYATKTGGIIDMLAIGNKLYLVSLDMMFPGTATYSTVYEYDFDTAALTQIGEGAGSGAGDLGDGGVVFTCLAYHQGFLYAGVGSLNTGGNSTASGVYRIRPGVDTAWTYDFDNSGAADADHETPVSMASYKGLLYVGMHDLNTAASHVRVRSAVGAYTSSTSMGGGTGSAWPRMKVFGDNLYATAWDNNGGASASTIRKFDGSSWSTVKTIDTGVAAASARAGMEMLIHNSILYVLAIDADRNGIVTYSANGTSWTDQNSGMTNINVLSIFGVFTD